MQRPPQIAPNGLPLICRWLCALVLLGNLSGCLSTTIRYLDVRGTVPSPSTLPVLAPSSETRASVRVGTGLSSTTRPGAQAPDATLDLRVPLWTGQADGLLSLGSHVVLGYRHVPEGGDLLFGIVGRPGPFEILGYGAAGLRRIQLDRRFERTVSSSGFAADEDVVDTVASSSRRLGPTATVGLSCLTSLADRRLQPFASASLQMGPRLAGDGGGDTPRDEALSFGSAAIDVGARANLPSQIGATAGVGFVQGTGVFHDGWARGFVALEWRLGR